MHPKDAAGIANSVSPDQTAPIVWPESALFAQTCLSENLGTLRYIPYIIVKMYKMCLLLSVERWSKTWLLVKET